MVLQLGLDRRISIFCLLTLLLCHLTNAEIIASGDPSNEVCMAEQGSPACTPPIVGDGGKSDVNPSSHFHSQGAKDNEDKAEIDSLLHRGMQGLEAVLDKMASSSDQMMHDMIESMSESRAKIMAGLDSMMDKMTESRIKMMTGLDAMMEKVTKAKEEMKEGFDNVMDQVSHSKMMEEIDLILESIKHSKVMMELRALPEEIRQSFILSARNRSYIAAGVLVAIAAAVLFGGAVYYAWCHHDAWSYYIGTIDEAKALLKQYKESGLLGRSRTSSQDSIDNGIMKDSISANDKKNGKENGHQKDFFVENSVSEKLNDNGVDLKQLKEVGIEPNCDEDLSEDDDDVFEEQVPSNIIRNRSHLKAKETDVINAGDKKQKIENQNDSQCDE